MPLTLTDRAFTTSPIPLVTAVEARMLGIPVRTQRYIRIRRGIYAERAAYSTLTPWDRYAARVHAFARTHPDAVLCLESAAVVHGLPRFRQTRWIHVLNSARQASGRYGDVAVHASVDARDTELIGGIAVTSLVDTVVDLVRVLPPAQALAVADAAISQTQGGEACLADLRDRGERQSSSRGRARMRLVWGLADGRAESPGESVSRAVILWSGFEQPDLQRQFHYENATDRVDFFFASIGGIGESDGWQKYALGSPEAAAVKLADEKRREDRLRRHGHPFARWDLTDAWHVKPVVQALDAIHVPRVRPPSPALLATVSDRSRQVPPLPAAAPLTPTLPRVDRGSIRTTRTRTNHLRAARGSRCTGWLADAPDASHCD
ncbi:hypothetical protein L2X99_00865 [Microbacterium sp. KUDC0406]|uniref:hypothetical protein n=1 Tax=Microbacterium sp. KUDC0406 TaxID=2909588 RepID=UPI001F384E7E|nr:hypothetical protein [Microbacterium sp. KUDC0406]UJP10305.1 hypothetical protein L2X99_00865 [Microbacterium sp. KUDC0406]